MVILKSLGVAAVTNLHQHAIMFFPFFGLFFHTNYQIKVYPFLVYLVRLYVVLMGKKVTFYYGRQGKRRKRTHFYERIKACMSL